MRLAQSLAALLLLSLGSAGAALAHDGKDADDDDADDAPQAQLDKAAQRGAAIRTLLLPQAVAEVSLPARVVADPRRELRVAAPQEGVVEAEGGQLPIPGQVVRAGQVLAWLRPVLTHPDRSDVGADLAVANRDKKLGRIQIDRYGIDEQQQLEIKLPTPSIEILTTYRSAEVRSSELEGTLSQPLPLLAPRAGIILRSPAVAGRVVAGGQALFDINAPGAAAVEAEFVDDDIDASAAHQAHTLDGQTVPLLFLGATYDAALRSRRALYSIADADTAVFVNQPLLLQAPHHHDSGAYVLPAQAIFKHDGHTWVWLHADAGHFVAQRVEVSARSGGTVEIGAGLHDGERVVTEGTSALAVAARLSAQ